MADIEYTQPSPTYGSFREAHVEDASLDWLSRLGWATAHGPDMAPEGRTPERASYGDVLLLGRFRVSRASTTPENTRRRHDCPR